MKNYLFSLLLSFSSFIYAQDTLEFTDLYGDYLGQAPPGDTPVVFAPNIISTINLEHSPAMFSSNGNEVYWVSGKVPIDVNYTQKLWYMKRINNRWTKPEKFNILADSFAVGDFYLSTDGNRIFFSTERKGIHREGITKKEWMRYYNFDIFYIKRVGQKWSIPKSISQVINTYDGQSTPSFSIGETLYFVSYLEGVESGCGIFRSKFKNGEYITPEALPSSINSKAAQDWTPFIAEDDSYLIFSSYREGQIGNGDLYISFHNIKNDSWSTPLNMGAPINTRAQERFPTISPDGKYLFFTRWTKENNQDIFWVKSDIINKLKQIAEFEK